MQLITIFFSHPLIASVCSNSRLFLNQYLGEVSFTQSCILIAHHIVFFIGIPLFGLIDYFLGKSPLNAPKPLKKDKDLPRKKNIFDKINYIPIGGVVLATLEIFMAGLIFVCGWATILFVWPLWGFRDFWDKVFAAQHYGVIFVKTSLIPLFLFGLIALFFIMASYFYKVLSGMFKS